MWELWTCILTAFTMQLGELLVLRVHNLLWKSVQLARLEERRSFPAVVWEAVKVFDLWNRQTSECFSYVSWMNLLRYEAVSASGVSLVKELLFLLFVLVKTQSSVSLTKLSMAQLCEHNQSHYHIFCGARCGSGNADLCQLLCVCQIIHSDGQEDVQQCVCHDRG